MIKGYEDRGVKMARRLAKWFDFYGCTTLESFEAAERIYNKSHERKLHSAHGQTRITFLFSDYVVKFTFVRKDSTWDRAGNNDSEVRVYAQAVVDGFAHLLAKPTQVEAYGYSMLVMPRINEVNNWGKCWWDHVTYEEYVWLNDHVCDIHDGNVGYYNRKAVVIDYAWEA